MSTRNDLTYKPMVNAGKTVLILRIIMIVFSMIPLLIILVFPTVPFAVIGILGELFIVLSWISSLLLLIFLYINFKNMDSDTRISSENKQQVKLGRISLLILIIILSLYAILYFILYILYIELGVITISLTLGNIIGWAIIVLEIFNGILFIIVFVALNKILGNFENLGEFRFLVKFILLFGIFTGIGHLLVASNGLFLALPISNPVLLAIFGTVLASLTTVLSLAGLFGIILSIGFILIGRRLQAA